VLGQRSTYLASWGVTSQLTSRWRGAHRIYANRVIENMLKAMRIPVFRGKTTNNSFSPNTECETLQVQALEMIYC
jgi:hypothetical protein